MKKENLSLRHLGSHIEQISRVSLLEFARCIYIIDHQLYIFINYSYLQALKILKIFHLHQRKRSFLEMEITL